MKAVARVGSRSAPIKTSTYLASTSNGSGESKTNWRERGFGTQQQFFLRKCEVHETYFCYTLEEYNTGICLGHLSWENVY